MMSGEQNQSAKQTYKRLLSYVKPYWLAFLVAVIANACYASVDVFFIKALEPLTDEALFAKNQEILKIAPFFVIAMIAIRGVAGFFSTYCMAWVGRNLVQRLREHLFAQYMLLPASFYDKHSSGELLSKVTFNTERVAKAGTDALTTLIRESAAIIATLVMMFITNWKLTLFYLIALPIIAALVSISSRRFRKISRKIQTAMADVTHVTSEAIEGYKVVKTFGGQEYEKKQFNKVANKNRQQAMKFVATKAVSQPVIQLIAGLALALVIFLAVKEFQAGALTPGEFVTMASFMMYLLKPLKQLTKVNATLQEGVAGAASVFAIMDLEPEADAGTKPLSQVNGDIKLNNVSFSYNKDDRPVLANINLHIKSGQTIALVGPSGSGKSTLTNLLLRFYQPSQGEILIDDVNINDFKLDDLRRQFAYVSQHLTLFNDTVARNIAYGRLENTAEDEIIQAAKTAYAWDFISKLPEQLNTEIGNDGLRLSGGQRQRLVIARALLKNAPLLILDEATSALDTEVERKIQAALEKLMKDRTTVVIAHRLSTIENADLILVMKEGQIVETGKHQELLQQNGEYAHLYQLQFSTE